MADAGRPFAIAGEVYGDTSRNLRLECTKVSFKVITFKSPAGIELWLVPVFIDAVRSKRLIPIVSKKERLV